MSRPFTLTKTFEAVRDVAGKQATKTDRRVQRNTTFQELGIDNRDRLVVFSTHLQEEMRAKFLRTVDGLNRPSKSQTLGWYAEVVHARFSSDVRIWPEPEQ